MTSVRTLAEREERNLNSALAFIGDSYSLVTDIEGLYGGLSPLIKVLPNGDPDQSVVAGLIGCFALVCRRQLTLGTLTMLRGYLGDSQLHLRRALETCGIAARIYKFPHMATVYYEAGKDETTYEKFRKSVATNLFPIDDPLLSLLGQKYDSCSKYMHSSIYGVGGYFSAYAARQASSTATPLSTEDYPASLDVFDMSTYLNMIQSYFSVAHCHKTMLRIFERSLKQHIGDDLLLWSLRLDKLDKKYDVVLKHWLPKIIAARNKKDPPAEANGA